MSYKRDIENTSLGVFAGEGKWDVPVLSPVNDVSLLSCKCVGFNYCNSLIDDVCSSGKYGLHFFLDDYQFERLWRSPKIYIPKLARFKYICAPDYSLYTDHPRALQMYNHYRKHWLAAYYGNNGIVVIPTICWSDCLSFEWCFDGETKKSIIAISTKGTHGDERAKERFFAGYYQMMKRLEPTAIMLFGNNPGALDGNIIEMGYEFKKMKRRN